MKPFPHCYQVTASAGEQSAVELESNGLKSIMSSPPVEFDGPGDLWSPETLLVGAIADCFILTFRAIAKAARVRWISLTCDANGTVDLSNGNTSFTAVQLRARLVIPDSTEMQRAEELLDKTKKACLISNSLKCTPTFKVDVAIELAA
jgi:peroxiredoxin-like protein